MIVLLLVLTAALYNRLAKNAPWSG